MVKSDTRLIIAIAAVLVMVAGFAYISLPDISDVYPESEMVSVEDMRYMKAELNDFRVVVSYHSDKIYEGTEFRVDVFDKDTEKVAEGANVSFMLPGINHVIPKEGSVYFYAPAIKDKYLLHPNDTSRTFPITVKKEGYNTYNTTITVYLAE